MTATPLPAGAPLLPTEPEDEDARRPGASSTYGRGAAFRRYLSLYALGMIGIYIVFGSLGSILLPNHIQAVEFPRVFTGADAGLDLRALNDLKAEVADGSVTPSAQQTRELRLLREFDAARAESLSLVAGIGVLVTMLMQPVIGVFSDRTRSRWGRRAPWIAGGAVVGALALVALRYSSAIPLIAVFYTIAAVAVNAAVGPLNATVADRVAPARRGVASAVQGLGLLFGTAIGAVLASSLFASVGLDAYFPIAVVVVVLCVLFVLIARDRSSKPLQNEPMRWGAFFRGFLEPLRSHDFKWAWIARAVILFGYTISTAFSLYMLQSYVQPALSAEQATATAPLLSIALIPAALVGLVVAGPLSDRLQRRKPFVFWASVLMAASYIVPLVSPTVTAMIVQVLIAGIAFGTFVAVDAALFLDVLPNPTTAGRDLGMAGLATNLGQAVAPLVAGQIVVLTGSYSLVWVASIVVVLIAGFAILPIKGVR